MLPISKIAEFAKTDVEKFRVVTDFLRSCGRGLEGGPAGSFSQENVGQLDIEQHSQLLKFHLRAADLEINASSFRGSGLTLHYVQGDTECLGRVFQTAVAQIEAREEIKKQEAAAREKTQEARTPVISRGGYGAIRR